MKGDPFDNIEKLKVSSKGERTTYTGTTAAPKSKKRNQNFTMVPHTWQKRLADGATCASTYRLALELLYRDWKNGGHPIRLANQGLEVVGLTRHQKTRALTELEDLGLVTVERRVKKSPIVKVARIG
jgi:hypothetical protein